MSLIEQAARRLEQLREAGIQVSGDLAFPRESAVRDRGSQEGDDSIERAALRLREMQGEASPPESLPLQQPTAPARAEAPAPVPPQAPTAAPQAAPKSSSPPASPALPAPGPARAATPDSAATPEPARPTAPAAQLPASPGKVSPSAVMSRRMAEPRARTDRPEPPDNAPAPGQARRSREVEIDFARIAARGLLTPDAAQSRLANELRVIKRPIINNCSGKGAAQVANGRRVMVTSAVPGEGKSFISMNLALSIAGERDSTVLLIEGDPTRPALAEMLGIPPARGLMDLLVDPTLDVADVMLKTNLGRLSFIPAGTRQEHATELLASKVMENLVRQLDERYPDRLIIFDSPPLLAAPEPRVLAQLMGQIVYVVEAEQTAQSAVQEAMAAIENCPVVMAVLNKCSFREEGYYYSYYYSQAE